MRQRVCFIACLLIGAAATSAARAEEQRTTAQGRRVRATPALRVAVGPAWAVSGGSSATFLSLETHLALDIHTGRQRQGFVASVTLGHVYETIRPDERHLGLLGGSLGWGFERMALIWSPRLAVGGGSGAGGPEVGLRHGLAVTTRRRSLSLEVVHQVLWQQSRDQHVVAVMLSVDPVEMALALIAGAGR